MSEEWGAGDSMAAREKAKKDDGALLLVFVAFAMLAIGVILGADARSTDGAASCDTTGRIVLHGKEYECKKIS